MATVAGDHAPTKFFGRHRRGVARDDVASAAQAIAGNAGTWHRISDADQIAILQDMKSRAISVCPGMCSAVAKTSGYERDDGTLDVSRGALGAMTGTIQAARVIDDVIAMLDGTSPQPSPRLRSTDSGAGVFKVWPLTERHKQDVGLGKATVEMYTRPGKPASRGEHYAQASAQPAAGAAVVLGGGNSPYLSFTDAMRKLFVDREPVILKHHDAQAESAPLLEYMLEPLRELGVYVGVVCDVPLTTELVNRSEVASVHMTGGRKTHDAIVWGPTPQEQQQRKAANEPALSKPMTSELGSCTPVLASPGNWTADEVKMRGRNIAQNILLNAASNCLTPRLILLPEEWHLSDSLVAAIKQGVRDTYPTPSWYPNSPAVLDEFLDQHDNIERVQPKQTGESFSAPVLPLAFSDVTLDSTDDADGIAGCQAEFFGPCVVIARLRHTDCLPSATVSTLADLKARAAASDTPPALSATEASALAALRTAYLDKAVRLANGHVHGNLVAVLWSAEAGAEERSTEVQRAVDALEYGSIVVNGMSFLPYTATNGMWGGFQSDETSAAEPQSGVGHVNNALLFDWPQKHAVWQGFDRDLDIDLALPVWLAKSIAGLAANGPRGVLQALRT